ELLDALVGARDRMQAAGRLAPSRKRDVDRLEGELAVEIAGEELVTLRLDAGLRLVDRRARARTLPGRQLAERLQELGEGARLAEETRLRLLEIRKRRGRVDGPGRRGNDFFEFVHQTK